MKIHLSEERREEILALHGHACRCISILTDAITSRNTKTISAILEQIKAFDSLEALTEKQHLQRIQKQVTVSEENHALHMELIDALKHILFYCEAIANNLKTSEEQNLSGLAVLQLNRQYAAGSI